MRNHIKDRAEVLGRSKAAVMRTPQLAMRIVWQQAAGAQPDTPAWRRVIPHRARAPAPQPVKARSCLCCWPPGCVWRVPGLS